MHADEEIINFLNGNPETWFSRKEISKKAVHRTVYEENPHWCVQPLNALVEQGKVEQNDSGHYRIHIERYVSKSEQKYDK